MGDALSPEVDAQGRERRGVYLPTDCWDWLDATADHDGSSRNDLLEGIVLLARDARQPKPRITDRFIPVPPRLPDIHSYAVATWAGPASPPNHNLPV